MAVPVRGKRMEPRIPEGARANADKTGEPKTGDIVGAIHRGETLVKELRREGEGLILVAIGPQPTIGVDGDTQIIGVVRMVMHQP